MANCVFKWHLIFRSVEKKKISGGNDWLLPNRQQSVDGETHEQLCWGKPEKDGQTFSKNVILTINYRHIFEIHVVLAMAADGCRAIGRIIEDVTGLCATVISLYYYIIDWADETPISYERVHYSHFARNLHLHWMWKTINSIIELIKISEPSDRLLIAYLQRLFARKILFNIFANKLFTDFSTLISVDNNGLKEVRQKG